MENKKSIYQDFDSLPLALTIDDVMVILGICRNSAYGLIRAGSIPSVRVGRKILIPKEALRDFLSV